MITLALDWTESDRPSLLRWIVPASVVVHVVIFAWLPTSQRAAFTPPPVPLVVEMVEPPPAPPPPPPEEPALPEQAPAPVKAAVAPSSARPAANDRRVAESSASPVATNDAPVDFTSTVFSNDGPGIAIGGGGGGRATAAAPAGTGSARVQAPPPPPRIVPPSSLARLPRAPGLDAELERHYPAAAKRSGISGSAVLRVRILPDGRIGETHVVSESFAGFGPACERTVRAARWEPPIDRDGAPVTTEITYTCRFEVRS